MSKIFDKIQSFAVASTQRFGKYNANWANYSKKVAKYLVQTLETTNTSVEDFAHLLNISVDKAQHMLSGNYLFSAKDLVLIEKIFKINLLII